MTDIVERLNNLLEADPDPVMCELYATCKAKIERLTAAREMMQLDAEKYRDEAKTLLAEIKQLRRHKEEADRHIATIAQLRAEIERLQNTLKLHAGDCQSLNGEVTMFKERAEAAEADNERLRAALHEIAAYPHSEEGGEIARAALKKTKPHLSDCLLDRTCRALEPKTLLEKVEAANRRPVGDRHS